MLKLYSLLLPLLVPVVILHLMLRGIKNADYFKRWGERFGFSHINPGSSVIWIHAVSVGEARASVPLINALFERFPDTPVLVTTMTPTGSAEVVRQLGDRVLHCYVPYDLAGSVSRFLNQVRPCLAVIMETELWPNIYHGCKERNIPVVVANARMSESSMRGYLRFEKLTRATLAQVSLIATQSRADARRLRRMGASNDKIFITGSIKFEIKLPASLREAAESLRRDFGSMRPVWIAASTHEHEEKKTLVAFRELKRSYPDLLLLIVPRHPERFVTVAKISRRDGFNTALRSELHGPVSDDVEVIVADSMGELLKLYAAADVAFVGGSLVPVGGHNVLEACAVGLPVIFGPHMFNFDEISQLTLSREAGKQVDSETDLAAAVATYLDDANLRFETGENGKKLVQQNRGALEHTSELIFSLAETTCIGSQVQVTNPIRN
ncbi:MAG: lipid IV(A) 3-deoxy-D-manno-octulosonic acid transferase [Arenicellales bacterium]